MKKTTFLLFLTILLSISTYAQFSISTINVQQTIDFDNTISGVNEGQYDGTGFTTAPASGQLDSDAWEVIGFSTGTLNFGGSQTGGDFTKGASSGGVSGGGSYAFETAAGPNVGFGLQPTGGDYTPGSVTLKILNNTGVSADSVKLSYNLYINNNEARANSFNPSFSTDNSTFTGLSTLDETSILTSQGSVNWVLIQKDTTFPVALTNGGNLYIKWYSNDVSGGGSRDEFNLDDISIKMIAATSTPVVSAIVVDSNVTCNGFSNGGATASANGGIAPYTYAWSNSATTASITGVVAGTYSVTVTDGSGVTDSSSVSITQSTPLIASTMVDSNATGGNPVGGATASATGGVSAYTYAWSNAATTASITGLIAGTYSATVTDQSGCTDSASAVITAPIVTYNVTFRVNMSNYTGSFTTVHLNGTFNGWCGPCNPLTDQGNGDWEVTLPFSAGTSEFKFTVDGWAGQENLTSGMSCVVTNGGFTNRELIVTQDTILTNYMWNSCQAYTAVTFASSIALDSNVSCNGNSTGGATVSASNGTTPYTYTWSNAATTSSITGVAAGTYSVTVTDNTGLTDSSSIIITEPTALITASVVDSNTTCNGLSNGGATASATDGTGAYTYAWSNAATTASITGVLAGTYSITITDMNGCTDSSSIMITEPAMLVVASVIDSNISCNGFADGGATASSTGGTMPYTYAWSNSATTASITGVTAGTYSMTITDTNGCTANSTATITEPAMLVAASVIDSNISCNGFADGGATASATGGTSAYSYAWSNAATTGSITSVAAGTYSVTITDMNGCTDSSSIMITEPTMLMATSVVDSNITCNGLADGGASASATSGTAPYMYAWSNAATTASITGVTAGTYSVTVTDANGCTSSNASSVTEPALLVASTIVDSNVTCFSGNDGGVTASAAGGTMPYGYIWSNTATTPSITGLMADTFSVLITDANGCMDTSSTIVTEPVLVMVDLGNDTSVCLNETVVIDAGAGFATYSWSDNTSMQTTTANTSMSGSMDYSVTVTNMNGCAAIDTMTVSVHGLSTLVIDPISDLCAYGVDTLVATPGFVSYVWNTSATSNELVIDASTLGQGTHNYSVTATDANGCVANDATTFGVYNEVTIDLGPDVSIIYIPGVNDVYTIDAGAGYDTYSWNNGDGMTQTYDVTLANMGHVGIEVTDANGCAGTDTIIIDFILSTPTIEIGSVKMYPNPVADVLSIEVSNFNAKGELDVKIMSTTGAMVYNNSFEVNGNDIKQTVDVSDFLSGTYFVEFTVNDLKTTKSFIVR